MKDPDGKLGLRIETASSVVLRDTVAKHMSVFNHVIRHDRAAGQAVSSVYIDGLAGTLALIIAGGHASKEDAIYNTVKSLKDAVDRDLQHLRKN